MPSWSDLAQHLHAQFQFIDEQPESFAIGFRMTLSPGKTDAQIVRGHREIHGQESWLVAISDLCPAELIDHTEALTRNASLMVGALALREGRCVVRHSWPLASVDLAEVSRGLQYLALGAAALQKLVREPAVPAPVVASPPVETTAPAAEADPNVHFSD